MRNAQVPVWTLLATTTYRRPHEFLESEWSVEMTPGTECGLLMKIVGQVFHAEEMA